MILSGLALCWILAVDPSPVRGQAASNQGPAQTVQVQPETAAPIIRRSAASAASTQSSTGDSARAPSGVFPDLARLALALGVVLALIFALRWLSRRVFPSVSAGQSSAAVRLLARSVVTPRQQVLLLQVGRRIVVAADNGSQLSPLSEITDADEIAGLLGQIDSTRSGSISGAFGALFGKATQQLEQDVGPRPETDAAHHDDALAGDARAVRGELSGLMDKIKLLTRQYRRS